MAKFEKLGSPSSQPSSILARSAPPNSASIDTWIRVADWSSLEENLRDLNSKGFGIFFGVNPRRYEGSDEAAVSHVWAFHVDLDGEPKFSNYFPEPSVIVDSDHGRHLYWRLGEPVSVGDVKI